jgi:sterol 3beta-glucosyltransferase
LRCTILAIGSRGDVHPLIALGAGLHAAGHTVCVASHADFEADVRARGMAFHPLTGNAARFFSGPAATIMRDRTRNAREFSGFFDNYLDLFFQQLLAGCWEASQDAEAILCWSWLSGIGLALAERLQVPVFQVASYPVDFPTTAFPNPFHGDLAVSAAGAMTAAENLDTWLQFAETAQVGHATRQQWRETTLGLPARTWQEEVTLTQQMPHLFGYSPAVLPKPADWPAWAYVTGYWSLAAPQDYAPTEDIRAFLAAHPRPVALGFSSQVGRNSRQLTELAVAALVQLRQPAILIAGFGGLKSAGRGAVALPEYILPVRSIPYDWLLPRVAAMVHQGGAGSVALALAAGVPSLAVAFGYDQAMWGQRIAALGAGAPPLAAATLTADQLAAAIRRLVEDDAFRRGAARISAILQQEDGVANAVRVVEEVVARQPISFAENSRLASPLAPRPSPISQQDENSRLASPLAPRPSPISQQDENSRLASPLAPRPSPISQQGAPPL